MKTGMNNMNSACKNEEFNEWRREWITLNNTCKNEECNEWKQEWITWITNVKMKNAMNESNNE